MGRWQPDARGRLGEAAMTLYAELGYEQVTVADIAERAGVTSRTFFRYFADKREVLFAGSQELGERLGSALAAAPADLAPLAAVVDALGVACDLIGGDHEHASRRQGVIVANPELYERELAKLASWSRVLADGLGGRDVDGATAMLAAETAVAMFRVAFVQWVDDPDGRTLADTLRSNVERLSTLSEQPLLPRDVRAGPADGADLDTVVASATPLRW